MRVGRLCVVALWKAPRLNSHIGVLIDTVSWEMFAVICYSVTPRVLREVL